MSLPQQEDLAPGRSTDRRRLKPSGPGAGGVTTPMSRRSRPKQMGSRQCLY
jgi:hypothetical protein